MGDTPDMSVKQLLSRAGAVGGVMAAVGVVLFVILWVMLADMEQFPRLIVSLCAPPAIMAALVGGYVLSGLGRRGKADDSE